jgi:hypothetical protein
VQPTTFACVDHSGGEPEPVHVTIDADRVLIRRAAAPAPRWLLLPGLSDAQVQVAALERGSASDLLSCGVTHVRDAGGPLGSALGWSRANDYPRVTLYGWAIDSDRHGTPLAAVAARSPASIARHVGRLARFGASGLKLTSGFPPHWVELAVRSAHESGLRVAYHIGSGSHPRFRLISVHDAIRAGVDSIEHIHSLTGDVLPDEVVEEFAADDLAAPGAVFHRILRAWARVDPDGPEARHVIDRFVAHRTALVPTLTRFAALIDQDAAGELAEARRGFDAMLAFVRAFAARGGRLAVGSGGPGAGVDPRAGFRSELKLFLRAGLDPADVLRAASAIGQAEIGLAPRAVDDMRLLVEGRTLGEALADIAARVVVSGDRVVAAPAGWL